jgi:Ca2+-binding EF-hand superfamily protein
MPVQIAFTHMDTSNHGFLTLHDFHQSFARLFCAINNDDIRALFNEIDSDGNGIIKYEEFETFYNENYVKKLGNIEKER